MKLIEMLLIILTCVLTMCLQDVGTECPTIISRKQWDGEKPKHRIPYLITPLDLVIIQHTITQSCSNDQACLNIVKDIQKTHMNEAILWDIGPSFLIANTGKIYEGRGWHHIGIHTFGYNNQSIGIAFIGNFNNQEPSRQSIDALESLIQCGVDEEHLTADYKIVVHSQLLPTESPGKKLASKIMSIPHWKQDVTEIMKLATYSSNNLTDTQEPQAFPESRTVGISKSRTKRQILTEPKEVDKLSNERDIIAELLNNIRKIAQQTLKTVEDLTRGLNRQVALFFERLVSRLRRHRDEINTAVGLVSVIPNLNKCTDPIKNRANTLYDNTEGKAKDCADGRINYIDHMIKDLGKLATDAINFSHNALEETRNCTELNFGNELPTKTCLNDKTKSVENEIKTYEAQRNKFINTISSALQQLPVALDECARRPLLEAASETTNIVSDVTNCKPFSFMLPGW